MDYPQYQNPDINQNSNQQNYSQPVNYNTNQGFNQYSNQNGYYGRIPASPLPQPPVVPVAVPAAPVLSPEEIEKANERKSFRKRCNILGLMILLAHLIFSSVSTIIYLIYSELQSGFTLPDNIDSIPDNIINGLANAGTFAVFAVIFIKILKLKGKDEVLVFEKVRFGKLMGLLAIGFTVSMLSNFMTNMYMSNVYTFGINLNFDIDTPVSNSALEIIVYLVSTALVPAFSEEILFRGVMLGGLRKYGDAMAVFVSSLIFGIFHANFIQFPFAFIVGLVLGFTTVYTNSLLPAILIHFSNNAFSVISDVMYTNCDTIGVSEEVLDIASFALVIIIAVIAIIAVVRFIKNDRDFLKLKPYDGPMDIKIRNKTLVTTPLLIIVTVYILVESVFTHLAIAVIG